MMSRSRMNADDPRHGTRNGYGNLKCRCQPCRDANTASHLDYMRRHPEQYEKHRLRERLKHDPTGEKARRRAGMVAAREAARATKRERLEAYNEIIDWIVRANDHGIGLREIARRLNVSNVPTRNYGQWHAATVLHILRRVNPNKQKANTCQTSIKQHNEPVDDGRNSTPSDRK